MQSVMSFRPAKIFVFQFFSFLIALSALLACSLEECIFREYEDVFAESDEWLYRRGCVESPYMDKLWVCIMLITYCKHAFAHL